MNTFAVIADPTRRRILDHLRPRERSVGELVAALDLPQPVVSKHLRILRDHDLVSVHTSAQRRIYRLRHQALADVDAWLAPYRRLWGASLDALERHLDDRK